MTPIHFFYTVIAAVTLVIASIALAKYYKPRAQREREEAAEREAAKSRREAVKAGTHDDHGNPLCVTCNDGRTIATEFDYKTVQTEGFWRWVCMTFFGAMSRYRIVRDLYSAPRYCRDCRVIVERKDAECLSRIAEDEQTYQEQVAIRLRRYVRTGRDEAIRSELEAHDKEAKRIANRPPAKVVDLRANG
jgi:hypothetical protein